MPALTRLLAFLAVLPALSAQPAWHEAAFPVRRQLDVAIDWARAGAEDQLAVADFHTAGLPAAQIRVYGNDRLVPSRVLMAGPGDRLRIAFVPARGFRYHHVYFGNAQPPAAPGGSDVITVQRGVLLEMRRLAGGGQANDFAQIEQLWNRGTDLLGRGYIPQPFLGFNPFGDEVAVVARYSGSLRIPADGEYTFAISASDKAGLYVDGKPLVYATANPADARFSARIKLTRGQHDVVVYQANFASEQRLTVAWQPPGQTAFAVIPPEAFGTVAQAAAGMLEEKDKTFTADMKIEYVGESFFTDHYAHHYRFSGPAPPPGSAVATRFEWDFGDGQTATGQRADHVYLQDGLVSVKVTMSQGAQRDSRTVRLAVSRLWERINDPPVTPPAAAGRIVAGYDADKLPVGALPWAAMLDLRANQFDPAERAALRLAAQRTGFDATGAAAALTATAEALSAAGRPEAAARLWSTVPEASPFQPLAAQRLALVLLWQLADFPAALKAVETQLQRHPADRDLLRLRGQALVLNGRAAEGAKVLAAIPGEAPADRRPALTGAAARTTEYYIQEGDLPAAQTSWLRWQALAPDDFLEGYSALLQAELMAKAKQPTAAARVAEAFALAVPGSAYAPRLLDLASRLLAPIDAPKSQSLRQLLKQKYPEDPLAQ